VPQFYRASRHEGKIEGRKAEVEKQIVHRRTERQNKRLLREDMNKPQRHLTPPHHKKPPAKT
jgi:hypothetical protein